MSEDTDFVSMYEELGLDAECGMDAFKQAYRRRVAALHPDMQGDDSDLPRLQRLNRMYEATLDFHRLHGRLPGASAPPRATRAPASSDLDEAACGHDTYLGLPRGHVHDSIATVPVSAVAVSCSVVIRPTPATTASSSATSMRCSRRSASGTSRRWGGSTLRSTAGSPGVISGQSRSPARSATDASL